MGCLKLPYKSEREGLKNNVFLAGEGYGNFASELKKCLYECQYYLKDHLGNNRVVFTTKPKTHEFTLNYEGDTNLPDDESMFDNLDNIIPANIHDHTDAGSTYDKSQLLNGTNGGVIGSVITIPVGAGDKISAEVYAKYLAPTGTSNPTAAVGSLLIAALTGNTGINNYEGSITSSYGTSGSMATGMFGDEVSSTEPMAFINLLFLPDDVGSTIENSHFAFSQISSASSNSHAILALDEPYEAPESGYIVVYLSNESTNLTEVYFDDLKVTVNEHPVIETNSFYPFGMQQSGGYQRVTAKENRFKFNQGTLGKNHKGEEGKFFRTERVTDLSVNWDMTQYRIYDYSIGRFTSVDPMAEEFYSYTTYKYSLNNPINYNDPDGKCEICKGFKMLGDKLTSAKTYKNIGNGLSTAASNVKNSVVSGFKSIDGLVERTFGTDGKPTEHAIGPGVSIDGDKNGASYNNLPDADPTTTTTHIEKEFVDGMTAGAQALKVNAPKDIGESVKKGAEAISKGSGAANSANEVFKDSGGNKPDSIPVIATDSNTRGPGRFIDKQGNTYYDKGISKGDTIDWKIQ